MKIPLIPSVSLSVSLILVALAATAPNHASAAEYSETSPELAPDTYWSISVGYCGAGDIIDWTWFTTGSLSFALFSSPDMIFYYGFASWDGLVVSTPGDYYLLWYNDDLSHSTTVSYEVNVFTPSLTITSPKYGACLNSTRVSLQGTYDGYANGVLVGPDSLHLREAPSEGTNWKLDDITLNEGRNTILVRSYYILDYYGTRNYTLDRIVQVEVDTVPPELATLYPAQDSFCSGQVAASWWCTDNYGIATEEVDFDAQGWQTTSESGYGIDLPSGAHTMRVRVTDFAGNQNLKIVNFVVDSIVPDLAITSPMEGSYVTEAVVISWQTSDDYAVAKEEVQLDSQSWETVQSGLPFYGPEGAHTVSVKVTDIAGNQVIESVNFTKDVNPPMFTALSPTSGSFVSGSAHLSWSCTDNFGVSKREVRVDSSSWREVPGNEAVVEVADGFHAIEIRATDLAGNTMVQQISVISDTSLPQVTIASPAAKARITRDSVIVSWTGSDDISGIDHYEVQITGGQWVDVGTATSFEFTNLDDMWYFVSVKAVDRSGNSATSTVHFGIYSSVWSKDGPYGRIPSYAVSAAIIAGAALSILLYWHKKRLAPSLPAQGPLWEPRHYPPRKRP